MSVAVTLAVEDVISEVLVRKLIAGSSADLIVDQVIGHKGVGFLKGKLPSLNRAAHNGIVSIVFADLDGAGCPLELIRAWIGGERHANLLFRLAVTEIEAWLLADHEGFAEFFAVPQGRIPQAVDEVNDPKQMIVNLVRGSRRKELRRSIVPGSGNHVPVGPEYNNRMIEFIGSHWNLARARNRSPSLNRAFHALRRFQPHTR